MKDSTLKDVKFKGIKIWKKLVIKDIKSGGQCAISKTEPIGEKDLYYYKGNLNYADIVKPKNGSYKVVLMNYYFHKVSTKSGTKMLVECKELSENEYTIKFPLNIKKKVKKKFGLFEIK
ncbi:MAG: hypothetical protein GY827_04870 [Cytophagales bacterium]|nr:hypothetical protein [Cytophagales bacterium]